MKKSLLYSFFITAMLCIVGINNVWAITYDCAIQSFNVVQENDITKNLFTISITQKGKSHNSPYSWYTTTATLVLESNDRTLEGTYSSANADGNNKINTTLSYIMYGSTKRIIQTGTGSTASTFRINKVSKGVYQVVSGYGLHTQNEKSSSTKQDYLYCYASANPSAANPYTDSDASVESTYNFDFTPKYAAAPTGVTASAITGTTATVSWTSSEKAWQYVCLPSSTTLTEALWTSNKVSTNSNSASLTGLTPASTYKFYVISDRGADSTSVIASTTFTTDCAPVASSAIPWSEGFESAISGQTPSCWKQLLSGSAGWFKAISGTTYKRTGSKAARLYGGTSSSIVTAVFPEFEDDINDLAVSFYYKATVDYIVPGSWEIYYGKPVFGYITDFEDPSTFVAVGDTLPQSSSYTYSEVLTVSGAPSGSRFALRYAGGTDIEYMYIDDISVIEKPSCIKPTGVSAGSVTDEGATISWNANGMSAWEMQVSEGDAASWGESINVTTNSKVLTGLNANTLYYVRVRGNCGAGNKSEWSDNVSFTTLCGTASVTASSSWNNDFEGLGDHVIPECWDNSASTTTSSWGSGYIWGTYERSSNKSLAIDNAVLDGGTALINTPAIAIPNDGREYELTFDYSNMAIAGSNLYVKISANGGDFDDKGTYYPSGNVSSYPGDFTTATISLADYSNKTIKVQFFANPTSGIASSGGAMFIDNVSVHKVPTCFQPTELAASNLTSSSAHMTWTAGGTETAWRLQYRADGGSWSAEQAISTNAQYDLIGLSANTEYFVRVKAYCDVEDESEWSEVASFTTLCAAAAMPFEENFSSSSALPSCWEATPASGTFKWSAYENSGAYSVQLRTGSSGEATLKMPAVALSEAAALTFEWKNASGTRVDVYISTNGGTTKTLIPSDLSSVHADWTNKTIDLIDYTGETVLIYFIASFSTANQYAYLDDVEVIARPCDLLTNVTASPTENGANIAWKGFVKKIRYKKGSDAWSTVDVASDYTGPKQLTGLASGSVYQACLLPQCKAEEEANWSDPIEFITKVVEDVPYSNDFNSETAGEIPFGWSKQSTSAFPQISEDAFAYGGTGKSMRFENVNEQLLVLPKFNMDLNLLTVSFDYRNRYCDLQFGYVEADGTTFTAIETLEAQTSYGEKPYKKDLYLISNDAAYLAFRYTNTTDVSALAFIDNMRVIETPECQEPTELYIRNLYPISAHIYWSASLYGNEEQYQYICVARNVTPNWASATLLDEDVRDVLVNSLTPNTEYDFYVRSYCRADAQGEPVKFEFQTACSSIAALPYSDNFEMDAYGDMPSCWYDNNGSDGFIYVDYLNGHNAAKSLHFAYHAGASGQIAVLPNFTTPIGSLRLAFWYKGNEGAAYETIQVGYMSDPTDPSTFVAVGDEFTPTATYQKAYVSFDGVIGIPRIAIRCAGATTDGNIYIDDVQVTKEAIFEDVSSATNNETRLEALMGQTLDITINRPLLLNGDYCTLSLPFDLSAEQIAEEDCPLHGFTIKEFESSESGTEVNIYLTEVDAIEAGKPYFVRYAGTPTDERLTPLYFRYVTVAAYQPENIALTDDCTPHGVFNPYALVANDVTTLFLSSNNTLYYPSANGTMNGFRAYIKVGGELSAPIRRGAPIRIVEKENTATGLDQITNDKSPMTNKILRDGQIIIIRDGKEYDIFGRSVNQ